jgi:hypothetical protein
MENLLNKKGALPLAALNFFSKDIGVDIKSSVITGCIQ